MNCYIEFMQSKTEQKTCRTHGRVTTHLVSRESGTTHSVCWEPVSGPGEEWKGYCYTCQYHADDQAIRKQFKGRK